MMNQSQNQNQIVALMKNKFRKKINLIIITNKF